MTKQAASATLIAALLLSTMLAGCLPSASKTATSTTPAATTPTATSADATSSASESTAAVPLPNEFVLSRPKEGTAIRKRLLDAARDYLGTDTSFRINQLLRWSGSSTAAAGNASALGDLSYVTGGKRVFVAWGKGGTTVVWAATASTDGEKALRKAVPGFPEELIDAFDWEKSVATPATDLKSTLSADAKTWASSLMSGKGKPYSVTSVKTAQDKKGGWWATVVVSPHSTATSAYEDIWFWCQYKGGAWKGDAVTGGDDRAPGDYFPSEVVGALGPF